MKRESKAIRMADAIAPNLMLRGIADAFFDRLERARVEHFVLDFADIESISRSFAHQYMTRKKASNKRIKEVNVPENIRRMLELVGQVADRPRLLLPKISQSEVITV